MKDAMKKLRDIELKVFARKNKGQSLCGLFILILIFYGVILGGMCLLPTVRGWIF